VGTDAGRFVVRGSGRLSDPGRDGVPLLEQVDTQGRTRLDFAAEVREFLKTVSWGDVPAPASSDLGKLFKAPPEGAWASVSSFDNSPSIRYSTVHGAKGMEFPGAVLVLSDGLRAGSVSEAAANT
jgi:hypothetical protein